MTTLVVRSCCFDVFFFICQWKVFEASVVGREGWQWSICSGDAITSLLAARGDRRRWQHDSNGCISYCWGVLCDTVYSTIQFSCHPHIEITIGIYIPLTN
jgi:hypothetical protein